jgi:predicted ATPase
LGNAALFHQYRREERAMLERIEAMSRLSSDHEFALWEAIGSLLQGWALAVQKRVDGGITQMRQSITTQQALGTELLRPYQLALVAEAYGKGGEAEESLRVLAEALTRMEKSGERWYEAELYRLKGTLTLEAGGWKLETSALSSLGIRVP